MLEDGRVVIMGGIAGSPYEELMALLDGRRVKPTLSVEIFERAIAP